VLAQRLGGGARRFFAVGLCAAGVSSAITAPIAAAITARSLFSPSVANGAAGGAAWPERGWKFRSVWLAVLGVGVAFGLAGVKPVPAIVLAQALNGILLPLVAVFLLLSVNDRTLMGDGDLNGAVANAALGLTVVTAVMLGVHNVVRALVTPLGGTPPDERTLLVASAAIAAAGAVPIWRHGRRLRRG
jgi:Mn2+/Fe2+ NRAMP family transporter